LTAFISCADVNVQVTPPAFVGGHAITFLGTETWYDGGTKSAPWVQVTPPAYVGGHAITFLGTETFN
jgi:hypothetical protein